MVILTSTINVNIIVNVMTIVHNDVNDHFTKYCDDNYDNVDNDPFSKYCDDNYNNDDNDYFSKYCDDNYDNDIKGDIYQIYQIPNTKIPNILR